MIRIALADDHEIVRSGLKMLIESAPDMKVVGEAADGEQAYELVAREKPDILLMDISMPPGQSGLVACGRITQDHPNTRIIVVTMFAEPEYLYFTLQGGAAGYLLKNSSSEELVSAIRMVQGGGTYIHPKMVESLTRQLFSSSGEGEDVSYKQLTTRELEILQLLAKGHTNKEISEKIYLSIKTVEAHRSKIYAKLGFKTRADLVAYAIRHKLLDL
ncbi:MAG TPA: response regulator transcription factor [Candidatus Aveggerthella stercoripullorum]|uniref:Response regulator transcription factor n=1 Tax=Candidatus Aveggerthella stercoripullorum TaxID=2840688 RepID=A0A9D1A0W4_9ACTN|nr:response regulator transcription factor [Candidatus Aveggerthella stercoripullorum]